MPFTETDLKKHLGESSPARLYLLYGQEPYLTAHYTDQVVRLAMGKDAENDPLGQFNLQRFDGQDSSWDAIEEAAQALPLMAERKCVVVRDFDVTASAVPFDRVLELAGDPPEDTVLIFWMDTVIPDGKKNTKWRQFMAAIEKNGVCAELKLKTPAETVKLLCSGASRRGCLLRPENARLLLEQCGDGLYRLLGELDKLCALALETGEGEKEITRTMIETAATKNLEASVFDLSKSLLQGRYDTAYRILDRLFFQREEPVAVLGVLISAYADLYRVKVAETAGEPAASLTSAFAYKGREFRLRNASRDAAKLSLPALRECLEVLAEADMRLKSSRMDKRTVLEQAVAALILTGKRDRQGERRV